MHYVLALFAGCLLHPGANDPCHDARQAQHAFLRRVKPAEIEWGENGTVKMMKGPTGIVLSTGIEGFQVGQPARELLEKIGPALLATGQEELRVAHVTKTSELPRGMPDRKAHVRLSEYIRGREVLTASVNISLDEQTNELTMLVAEFLPDRGLQHEPQLTAAEALAKAKAELREIPYQELSPFFYETPPRLGYAFEEIGTFSGIGGTLVWAFPVMYSSPENGEGSFGEFTVSAITGKIAPRLSINRYRDR